MELLKTEPTEPTGESTRTEELFLDENDRVYRINEHGEKTIVVTFDSPEYERKIKLELYMKKNFARIQEWHRAHGRKAPPLGYDEIRHRWIWMNRKMRRS